MSKPRGLISDSIEITPTEIMRLRGMAEPEAAQVLTNRLVFLEAEGRRTFVERGLILVEVDERELYRHVTNPQSGQPYTSFTSWVVGSSPYARSECFAAKTAVLELRDVPKEDLLQIARCNVEVLTELSPAVRKDPEIIAAAKTQTENDFEKTIQKKYPSQHREPKSKMFVKPTHSAKLKIENGLRVAAWVYGVSKREDIIEAVLADLLQSDCEVEGYQCDPETGTVLTNEEAYGIAKSRGEAA